MKRARKAKSAKTPRDPAKQRSRTRFEEHLRIAQRIAQKLGKKVAKLTGKAMRKKR